MAGTNLGMVAYQLSNKSQASNLVVLYALVSFHPISPRLLWPFLFVWPPDFCIMITPSYSSFKIVLRGYHALQGDNSLKSVERFDHMMFVCRC